MIAAKYWAIRCKNAFVKHSQTGWPYLTFTTRQAAQAWIDQHSIEGEVVRVRVKLEEVT